MRAHHGFISKITVTPSTASFTDFFFFSHVPALISLFSLSLSGGAGTAETPGGGG